MGETVIEQRTDCCGPFSILSQTKHMPRNVPSWATTVWPRIVSRTPSRRVLGGLDEFRCFPLVIAAPLATAALNNQAFVHVVCGLEVETPAEEPRELDIRNWDKHDGRSEHSRQCESTKPPRSTQRPERPQFSVTCPRLRGIGGPHAPCSPSLHLHPS